MNLEDVVIVVGLLVVVGIFAYAFYDLYFASLESGACIGNKCQNMRASMEYLTGLDLPTIDDYTPENYSLIKYQAEIKNIDNQFLLCKWIGKSYDKGRGSCEAWVMKGMLVLVLLVLFGMSIYAIKQNYKEQGGG